MGNLRCWAAVVLLALSAPSQAQQVCVNELPASAPTDRFELRGAVVHDTATGLTWRRCFEGLSGADCGAGELLQLSWPKALQHAAAINAAGGTDGASDWRLPNVKELYSLVESRCAGPALNAAVFPNAPAGRVWTSSPYRLYAHYSWLVDFADGTTFNLERFKPFPLLLVRGGDTVGD